ncbi:MAG TPA: sodium-translocating pyrophosphatase [Chloroflexota bacterium]|nr:sodium-translocating pyrophosphatase [Chloroflexota bacterium]
MEMGLVFGIGLIAVLFAIFLAWDVLRRDRGTPSMQEVAGWIHEGAMAFLRRQYMTIAMLAIVVSVLIGALIGAVEHDSNLGVLTSISFLVGAFASGLSGLIGMTVAVRSNIRTASAARRSLSEAITTALRGGAVSGFLVVSLSLLGVATIFTLYGGLAHPELAPFEIVGFGFGASFVALFAQLGGGIYTKAADVGADLVGKVEANIPEDDPRNAAVIADLVGDNVGDCAGRGADLFESTAAENIGAMILGVAIFTATGSKNPAWIFFPLVVRAFGLVASGIGLLLAGGSSTLNPMRPLNRGYFIAAGLSAIFMYFVTMQMLHSIWLVLAGLVGLLTSIAFVFITQYYTAGAGRPVQEIARASLTGPATNAIAGIAVGFETTGSSAIAIAIALFLSFIFGENFARDAHLQNVTIGGIYGTAIATMGMLMTAAYILAMDTFGPITDNAGGIVEMSGQPEEIREITDALDAAGNTTKALTKGYAVASAALAAFLLFSAYLDKVAEVMQANLGPNATPTQLANVDAAAHQVNLANIDVFIGALLGTMLVYLFSSLAIRAVGRAGSSIIEEVRRQFRENPGIIEGTAHPDYARCVDITTRAALREMVWPGLLAVGVPVLVGLILHAQAAAGLLMVGTIAGVLLATILNNSGGAWDNAKKYIEAGLMKGYDGEILKKGSPAHAAAVSGDVIGDPFKDCAGPSLHIVVKLLSTITLVLAPLFIVGT